MVWSFFKVCQLFRPISSWIFFGTCATHWGGSTLKGHWCTQLAEGGKQPVGCLFLPFLFLFIVISPEILTKNMWRNRITLTVKKEDKGVSVKHFHPVCYNSQHKKDRDDQTFAEKKMQPQFWLNWNTSQTVNKLMFIHRTVNVSNV